MRSTPLFFKLFTAILIFALVALPATAAAPAAGDQSIRQATMPPALDGNLSEWDGVPLMVLDLDTRAPNSSAGVERSDAMYTLQMLQTADALYLGFHARDEKLVADSGAELQKDDGLRFSVDGNKDGAGGSASDHIYRIRVNGTYNDNGAAITALTVVTAAVTGGYNIEVRIPASHLALPLGSTGFKFNWAAGDDDNGGGLDTYYLYAGTAIDAPEPSWPVATFDGGAFTPPGLLEAGRWEWHGGGSFGAVHAGSGGNVWAGGNGVWRTTNNGSNWNRFPLFAGAPIRDLRFWDANRGLALAGNKVYLSEDGGVTWRLSNDLGGNATEKLVTVSTDAAWLTASVNDFQAGFLHASILTSRDGGASWQWTFNTGDSMIVDLAAYGADRAWALEDEGSDACKTRLQRTTDGGKNWVSRCVADGTGQITGRFLAFADPLTGYLVGQQGNSYYQVWRTTDGGDTWQKQGLGVEGADWLTAYDSKTAWFAAGGRVYRTTDGVNWYLAGEGAPAKASFRNVSEGWGIQGRAIRRTTNGGATWSTVYTPPDPPIARWWDHLRGWRLDGGIIERTTDGGGTWIPVNTGLQAVDHLQMVTPLIGWAWHDGSLGLRKTTDGGATWKAQTTGSNVLTGLQFVSATHGWVLDAAGNLRRSTDGGATWSFVTAPPKPDPVPGPTNDFYTSVHFVNANLGIAGVTRYAGSADCAGFYGRTTDGGITWSALQSGPSAEYTFANSTTGWGIGQCDDGAGSNGLAKTITGGATWTGLDHPGFSHLDLYSQDAEQLLAYGARGRVDKSPDGGASFQPQRTEDWQLGLRSRIDRVYHEEPNTSNARLIYRNTEIPAYRAFSAPRIDGNLDDWGRAWQTSLKTSNAALAQGGIPAPLQSSGVLRALWDPNNLYLAIQVYDDEIHVDTPDKPWQDDAVEFGIDPKHDHLMLPPDDDRQYAITADGTQYLGGAPTSGLEVGHQQTADGYILEVRIPRSLVPSLQLTAGALAGFNFSILDDMDGGSLAETRLFWTGTRTSSPQASWGQIRFSAIDAETTPADNTPTPTPTSTATATPTVTVTPQPGNYDLTGKVYQDANGNGQLDAGEMGLVSVTVSLFRGGAQIGQSVTDGAGNYLFANLAAGQYTVRAQQPSWLPLSTTPNEVNVTIVNGPVTVNFGDWAGLKGYLPLLLR
jgi:hypothetical protein